MSSGSKKTIATPHAETTTHNSIGVTNIIAIGELGSQTFGKQFQTEAGLTRITPLNLSKRSGSVLKSRRNLCQPINQQNGLAGWPGNGPRQTEQLNPKRRLNGSLGRDALGGLARIADHDIA